MSRKRCIWCIVFVIEVCVIGARAEVGQEADLKARPVTHGLRLGLDIETTIYRGTDVHTIRIDLINVSKEPIVLLAEWPYEQQGNYAEYLKSKMEFVTFPEVRPGSAQTAGAIRRTKQPEQEIKPGESLTIRWKAYGRWLKPQDCFDIHNTTPYFSTKGLYGVRARVLLVTTKGKRILLTSNEEQVVVGGSVKMPKYATARIVQAEPDMKKVRINMGSNHGIEKTDQFMIRRGFQASWLLTITDVDACFAKGTVETSSHTGENVPLFPEVNWIATLLPVWGGFPELPPIEDADPSMRHSKKFEVPTQFANKKDRRATLNRSRHKFTGVNRTESWYKYGYRF